MATATPRRVRCSAWLGVRGIMVSGSAAQYSAANGKEKQCDEAVWKCDDKITDTRNVVAGRWVETRETPDAPNEDGEKWEAKCPQALARSEKPRVDKDEQCDDALSYVVGDGKKHSGNDT